LTCGNEGQRLAPRGWGGGRKDAHHSLGKKVPATEEGAIEPCIRLNGRSPIGEPAEESRESRPWGRSDLEAGNRM